MHFLYVFILQFLYNSTCFERPFRSPSAFHNLLYLQLCTNRANVSNCSVLELGLVWVSKIYIIYYYIIYISNPNQSQP